MTVAVLSVPATKSAEVPTGWVVEVHGTGPTVGPHTSKVTTPLGLPSPALPVTAAMSVSDCPRVMVELVGNAAMALGVGGRPAGPSNA